MANHLLPGLLPRMLARVFTLRSSEGFSAKGISVPGTRPFSFVADSCWFFNAELQKTGFSVVFCNRYRINACLVLGRGAGALALCLSLSLCVARVEGVWVGSC